MPEIVSYSCDYVNESIVTESELNDFLSEHDVIEYEVYDEDNEDNEDEENDETND